MPEQGGAQVALFIDWDNLAISTAADHGGANVDLHRIVQVAQSYGTLVIARAYAEWGVTSDRLTVYRAGVEPVYAPTFRFEADVPGQPSRGKSLADPCLVADCIDAMHLHPNLTHYVLVSGDKDLIPIVRLAQMRGKRVIVIGPDLVAAVLRDMADEYVPYRSIVGTTATGPTLAAAARAEADERGRRRRRRGGRGTGATAGAIELEDGAEAAEDVEAPEVEPPRFPARGGRAPREFREPREIREPREPREEAERRPRRPFADRAGIFGGRPEGEEPAEQSADVAAEAEGPLPPVEPAPYQRPAPRRREPAARAPEPAPELPAVEREILRAEPPAAPAPRPAPAPAAPVSVPTGSGDTAELWSTIAQILKERTGVGRPRLRATNLKDYLIARLPGFSEARYGFGRFKDLVDAAEAAGILTSTDVGQVQWVSLPDADGAAPPAPATPLPAAPPTPVLAAPAAAPADDATGAASAIDLAEAVAAIVEMRHRTRLLTQSYVLSNLGAVVAARAPGAPSESTARALIDRLVEEGAIRVDREPQEVDVNGAKHRVRLVHLADDSGLVRRAEEDWARTSGAGAVNVEPPASVVSDQPAEAVRSNGRSRGRRGRGGAQGAAETAPSADQAASSAEDAPEAQAGGRSRGGRRRGGREQAAETTPAPEANGNGGALERIYEALVEAVRGGIAPGKDTAGAAGVKSRLTAALGSFNERDLGFSKFKDFLEAAQRAGKVRVETAGAATRVGLPGDAGA